MGLKSLLVLATLVVVIALFVAGAFYFGGNKPMPSNRIDLTQYFTGEIAEEGAELVLNNGPYLSVPYERAKFWSNATVFLQLSQPNGFYITIVRAEPLTGQSCAILQVARSYQMIAGNVYYELASCELDRDQKAILLEWQRDHFFQNVCVVLAMIVTVITGLYCFVVYCAFTNRRKN